MNDLPAGRELDVLVAKKVMGWTKPKGGRRDPLTGKRPVWRELPFEYVDTPHFSTDIAAAWEVVEKFAGQVTIQGPISVGFNEGESYPKCWTVGFTKNAWNNIRCEAETAPLAICRAALRAVEASGARR